MKTLIIIIICTISSYSIIGTPENVEIIKKMAKTEIPKRGWEIKRYEGYNYGSWGNHGGKVWYHVKDTTHKNTYYRVYITLWDGELHYNYGAPEELHRINLDH